MGVIAWDVTILVGTYGGTDWIDLARSRAIPSADALGVEVIHRHGSTLAQARNEALALARTEWVIHLDADDELEPGYLEAMAAGTADLRAPSVRMVPPARARPIMPKVYGHGHACEGECLRFGNWLVVGSAVRADLAREFGWEEFGWSEDWALWARCWRAGASIEAIPAAVYRAHRREGSRNRVPSATGLYWHRQIERAVWPDEPSILNRRDLAAIGET